MCFIMSLGGKGNILELQNHVSTSMFSAFDLWTPNSIGNIFLQWVVHMCDMVILGGKGNFLEPGNCISTSMFNAIEL
jgi:hypothetical protein